MEATDNIGVARVRVTIRDEQGQVMARGEAIRGGGNWWKFTPQTEGGSLLAEAWDLPKSGPVLFWGKTLRLFLLKLGGQKVSVLVGTILWLPGWHRLVVIHGHVPHAPASDHILRSHLMFYGVLTTLFAA